MCAVMECRVVIVVVVHRLAVLPLADSPVLFLSVTVALVLFLSPADCPVLFLSCNVVHFKY